MRIVIDMQGAQTSSRFRGIGRYTLALAQAIVRNRGHHDVVLILNDLFPETVGHIRATFDGLLPQENIRIWYAPGPVRECENGNDCRREVAELLREAFLGSLRPDIILVSSLFEGYLDDAVTSIGEMSSRAPTAVILYDLIPLLNPESYLDPNPEYAGFYHRKIEHLLRADAWLAISDSSAREGCEALGLEADRVINISTACDAVFRPEDIAASESMRLMARLGITQPFALYSGGADLRKNLHRLIKAFAIMPPSLRETHQLVLAGKMTESVVAELRRVGKSAGLREEQLLFAGYVTDDELVQLYNLCKVSVLPSLYEGFGLPALEAMACGAAVIASNTTSLPEVVGRQDALFDPESERSIAERLAQVLGDDAFNAELATYGLEQAKKFSWDESARRAIAAIERLSLSLSLSYGESLAVDGIVQHLVNDIARLPCVELPAESSQLAIAAAIAQNHPEPRRYRKLFVDISELVQRDARTGVQRVTRSILRELLLNPPADYLVQPVYALVNQYGYRSANNYVRKLKAEASDSVEDVLIEPQPGDIFLGLDLQQHVVQAQADYLKQIHRLGVGIHFVIYDLLPILHPYAFPPEAGEGHSKWLKLVTQFDSAICISKSVADELAGWLKSTGGELLRQPRINWFHLGADIQNSDPSLGMETEAESRLALLKARPTFLMVGTLEPRKGHAQTVEAFEQLWQSGLDVNLAMVGKRGWMVEALIARIQAHPELNTRLFWFDGISDEYLEEIYAASTCLIAASYGEGFGLPLIEAAQHKLPIMARDIPVFREVAREHASYFEARLPEELAHSVKSWLKLFEARQHPVADEMPWLTWSESAEQIRRAILPQESLRAIASD